MHSSHQHRAASRAATTLPELIVVVAIVAIATALVLPPLKRGFDRIQTRNAALATMMAFFSARANAIAQGRRTAVLLDGQRARVLVLTGSDTLMVRALGADYGVSLIATRDSMSYFPDGLGLGGANLSAVFSRGSAVDTVLVSREGRVKLGARAR